MTKKTKPSIKLGFQGGFSIVTAIFIFAILLKNSALASAEVIKSLKTCSSMIIPSIFPLTVASEILTRSGATQKTTQKLSAPIAKILGVSKTATTPYFLGLCGGYTSSCKSAILLYQGGQITKRDCESIIALSNMPSLAFMTGFVGSVIFKDSTIGWILWGINILSTLILGVINNIFFKKDRQNFVCESYGKENKKGTSQILVSAIVHSAQAMLTICACVVFFSVLIAVLDLYLMQINIPNGVKNVLLGAFEITKGIENSTQIESSIMRTIVCAFFSGWSGLCVHFQVIALCDNANISFKKYFLFKALQGIICILLSMLIL